MIGRRPRDGISRPAWLIIVGFAVMVAPPFASRAAEPVCDVPGELMEVDGKLPHLAERLRAREPVKIVAIGGASTAGLAAGSADRAYPRRTAAGPRPLVPRGADYARPTRASRIRPRRRCWSAFRTTCSPKTRSW